MSLRITYFSIFLTCLLCGFGLAEEGKPERTCRIVFLKGPEDAPKKLHLFDGKTSQEVELPRFNLSPSYEFSGEARAVVLTPDPVESPESIPSGAPQVVIPEGVTDCYLLIVSDPSNKVAPVKIRVIDAGRGKFRKGQMMWYNLSDKAVGGKVGSEELAMDPGSKTVIDAPASGYEEYKVMLNYRRREDEKLHPLCETKWRHDPQTRTLLFIVSEPGTRTPRIMGFPDDRTEPIGEKEGGGV